MIPTTTQTQAPGRAGAATVALAPVVLLIAFVSHPFLASLPDAEGIAEAVAASSTRWAFAHLLTAVASGLVALAFLAVRALLRGTAGDEASRWGLPFVVFGSVMYAVLPGLEFAPLAAAETGGDVAGTQASLETWFVPILVTAVLTFAIGVFGFARAVRRSEVLGGAATWTVVVALVVMAVARAVPLGVAQFYVQPLAGLVALWPLAAVMWRATPSAASARTGEPSPAT